MRDVRGECIKIKMNKKEFTKKIVHFIKDLLYKCNPDNQTNAFLVLLIHYSIVVLSLCGLFACNYNWKFHICVVVWVCICILHIVFNGCILTRIERELWNTKDWKGPWSILFECLTNTGITVTKSLANDIYVSVALCITTFIVARVILKI